MKPILDFLDNIRKGKKAEIDWDSPKKKVLFITATLDGTGLYRSFIPWAVLNNTETHIAFIATTTDRARSQYRQQFDAVRYISADMVKWADYIVFPCVAFDLHHIVTTMRETNPSAKMVFDIDDNYDKLHEMHPQFKEFTSALKKSLIHNMGMMDIITSPSKLLLDYYRDRVKNITPRIPEFKYFPNHFLPEMMHREPLEKPNDIIKIGLIVNSAYAHLLNAFRPVLAPIMKKYRNKVEIISFGWNGHYGMFKKALPDGVTCVEGVGFNRYFDALHTLNFDIGIIPMQDSEYTNYKAYQKFIEYASTKTAVVCGNSKSYTEVCHHGSTAMVCNTREEWMITLEDLIDEATTRIYISEHAHTYAKENCCWNDAQPLTEIFK